MAAPLTLTAAKRAFQRVARFSAYDGRHRLGTILDTGSGASRFVSFDSDGALIGAFATQREAVAALPGGGR